MEHLQAKVGLKCVPELPLGQICFVKRDWSQSEWLSHGWSKEFSGRPPLPHHLKINNIVLYGCNQKIHYFPPSMPSECSKLQKIWAHGLYRTIDLENPRKTKTLFE